MNSTPSPIDNILPKLKRVTGGPEQYTAKCPGHDDSTPSLSIAVNPDGTVLLCCHTGCTTGEVCDALGIKPADLFPGASGAIRKRRKTKAVKSTSVAKAPLIKSPVSAADIDEILSSYKGTKTVYEYTDSAGSPVFYVARIVGDDGGKTFRPLHVTDDGKIAIGDPTGKLPLYKLRSLLNRQECWVVEGEWCAESMREIGMITTTSAHGAQSAAKSDWTPLQGMTVNIVPDDDRPGRKYAQDVANILGELCCTVRIVTLPTFDEPDIGFDVYDFIVQKRDAGTSNDAIRDELETLASAVEPEPAVECATPQESNPEDGKPTTSVILLQLVNASLDSGALRLWATPDGDAYATFTIDFEAKRFKQTGLSLHAAHAEHWPVRSMHFRRWLMRSFWTFTDRTPAKQAVEDVLIQVEGMALWMDGAEIFKVCTRFGATDTNIYLDLADRQWRCVEVTLDGWSVVTDPLIKFRRCRGILPLPEPQHGGSLNELRDFINVDDDQFVLVVAWLVGTFLPKGPYVILEVDGEQGATKSTACNILRRLVDPNEADLRSTPREERDLIIAAKNGHVIGYDNLSGVPAWLSDALSRVATGAGFATRELYSDSDETIFSGARPIVCNGIGGIAVRPDLLDRTIKIVLQPIPENRRRRLADLMCAFDEARPRLLGALLDAVATALRRRASVELETLPRMADFAHWIVASEPSLPWESGKFLSVYGDNRKDSNDLAIEASMIGAAIIGLNRDEFDGTATELLSELNSHASVKQLESRGWPKSAQNLSVQVRRISANLRRAGIDVQFDHRDPGTGRRTIRWVKVRNPSSHASHPSRTPPTDPETPNQRDATVTPCDAPDDAVTSRENGPGDTESVDCDGRDGRDASLRTSSDCGANNTSAPDIPAGWKPERWVVELERKADCCRADHPEKAADFTAKAKLIRKRFGIASLSTTSAGSQSTDDDDELAPGETWEPEDGVGV